MTKISIFLLCSIGVFFFIGNVSAEQPKWMESPTGKLVQDARNTTKQIPIEELKKVLDEDEDIVLLDVRTPREYEAVHIPGAVNISRGLLEFSIWSVVPDKEEKIYVYCKSGARAALATKQLNDFGYKNAVSVTTGMADWVKSGNAVQTSISDEQIILIPAED
ncbi:MAG: rhodanese-related sulfurtransferase [Desulforhopalus sp.]|jgi:rhodanese-related sulfurtransferase